MSFISRLFGKGDADETGEQGDLSDPTVARTSKNVCPSCRSEQPEGALFCIECGAGLAPPQPNPPGNAAAAKAPRQPEPRAPAPTAATSASAPARRAERGRSAFEDADAA